MKVWLVFKWIEPLEFCGVFSTQEAAITACREVNYCICPAEMDVEQPLERMEWAGAYYPHLEPAKV